MRMSPSVNTIKDLQMALSHAGRNWLLGCEP